MGLTQTYLSDEEPGGTLRKTALRRGEDHLEHVALELLHDDEDTLGGLKHALQVDYARVGDVLQDCHLVLQLGLLLVREPRLVDYLDRHRPAVLPARPCAAQNTKLGNKKLKIFNGE